MRNRELRELKRRRIVRYAIILFACLLVMVLFLERGARVSLDNNPTEKPHIPPSPPSDPTHAYDPDNTNTNADAPSPPAIDPNPIDTINSRPNPDPDADPNDPYTDPIGPDTDPIGPDTDPIGLDTDPNDPYTDSNDPDTDPNDLDTDPNDPDTDPNDLDTDTTEPINTSPTDPTETPAQAEKRIRKEKENAEKAKLESLVWKEYEDQLANSPPNTATTPAQKKATPLLLPKPLLFLHVPKTAGSTLGDIFKKNELREKYFHFWSHPRLAELPKVPSLDTVFGHFRYGLHFYYENRTASYATMLRDPVERIISYYHFHLQDPMDPAHQFALDHPFEEWLDISPSAQNEMTKCVSGIRSEFSPSLRTFELAKHHLRNFGYVGLTERFDESLVLMKYYFGFQNLDYGRTKVGVKKPKVIAPELLEKIRKSNWMDIELYEMAKEIFEKQMAEVGRYLLQLEMHKS